MGVGEWGMEGWRGGGMGRGGWHPGLRTVLARVSKHCAVDLLLPGSQGGLHNLPIFQAREEERKEVWG